MELTCNWVTKFNLMAKYRQFHDSPVVNSLWQIVNDDVSAAVLGSQVIIELKLDGLERLEYRILCDVLQTRLRIAGFLQLQCSASVKENYKITHCVCVFFYV